MLAAVGCQSANGDDEIMSKDAMVTYLIDLHIAEAQIQNLRLRKDSSDFVFELYERHLLKKNGITDSLFTRSYNYYLQYPDKLEDIYESVVDSISVRKSMDDVLK